MLVTSFSQAYPKRPFTTTLANGRIGWTATIGIEPQIHISRHERLLAVILRKQSSGPRWALCF